MSLFLSGIGISRGVVIGRVRHLFGAGTELPEYTLPAKRVEPEVERYRDALERARGELRAVKNNIPSHTPADIAAFIDTHLLMLQDSALSYAVIRRIRGDRCNAEWALKLQREALVSVFEEMDDAYLRTRRDDVDHVVNRVQRILADRDGPMSTERASGRNEHLVVLADDVSPADLVMLQHQGVSAFMTEFGGPLSHTAILARSLRIPAVVGLRHARRLLRDNERLIIDGRNGAVLADPDERALAHYRRRRQAEARHARRLEKLRDRPAVTADGHPISLRANIELPEDMEAVRRVGAAGVGLYRTEFLYLNRSDIPDEEEQLDAYLRVLRAVDGGPVTIRTVDLGADKPLEGHRDVSHVVNPALGLRAVRLCLKDPALFMPQLRALLRASAYGPVQIMIPMLSTVQEVVQVSNLVRETRRQLQAEGHETADHVPLGAMIEVPAAALAAPHLARHVDFFSIGTNDLIQYALAIDRIDDEVNYLYDPLHPAVLHLISMTIQAGRAAGIPVAMCGEMAGDPAYTRLLLGMGLTEFSMQPSALLEVKSIVTASEVARLRSAVRDILASEDADRLTGMLGDLNSR